jgi:hypothetical protein
VAGRNWEVSVIILIIPARRASVFVLSLSLLLAGVSRAQDSLNVRLIGSCDTPGWASDVALNGDYAYVADYAAGLRIISVADPAHPVEVGHCHTPAEAFDVAVNGDYAYVAADTAGLRVISVADPANPAEVGYCDTPGLACGVVVNADFAYVVDASLRVISVADPANPAEVGYCYPPDYAIGVAASGDYVYLADAESGLRVVSVADPAHPVEAGHYVTSDWAMGVAVRGNYAYVVADLGGLQIYHFYGAGVEETPNTEMRTENRMPTIVRGVLMMGQQLAANGSRPELVDATGRTVAELHAGANDVSRLAPGVYFVNLDAGDKRISRKVVLQR